MNETEQGTVLTRALRSDVTLSKLARDIAWDIYPLETVLGNYNVTQEEWQAIKEMPRFQRYLENEIATWANADNTAERVKIKSQALIEDYLPEIYERMIDPTENLPAKVEAAKFIGKLAGLGNERSAGDVSTGEKVSITINLGEDRKLTFEKDVTPVIEGDLG